MYILREPHPLFKIALWCLLEHGSHTPISYAYACIKSKYLQACRDMPIDWLVLQALGVLPLQYVSFWITWDCCCAKHAHHIQVKSESYPDCCPGHPGQELWPSFNAAADIPVDIYIISGCSSDWIRPTKISAGVSYHPCFLLFIYMILIDCKIINL